MTPKKLLASSCESQVSPRSSDALLGPDGVLLDLLHILAPFLRLLTCRAESKPWVHPLASCSPHCVGKVRLQIVKTTPQVSIPEHGRYFPGPLGQAEPMGPQQTTCTRVLKSHKTVHEGHICGREEPGFPGDASTLPGATLGHIS